MKVEGSNITINDSVYNKMSIIPKGACEQEGVPTPDYPQDIRVVTGDNSVVVSNVNQYPIYSSETKSGVTLSKNSDGSYTLNGLCTASNNFTKITTIKKGTYSLQCKYDGTLPNDSNTFVLLYKADFIWQEIRNNNTNGVVRNFTIARDETIEYRIRIQNGHNYDNVKIYPMLVFGTYDSNTMPNYTEPKQQVCPIHLGTNYLAGIDEYKDEIVGSTDNWKIKRKIKKLTFIGTEGWNTPSSYQNLHFLEVFSGANAYYLYSGFSNYFTNYSSGAIDNADADNKLNDGEFTFRKGNQDRVYFKGITGNNDFKTWLSTHNTILYYILATPVEETITDTQLIESLNNMYQAMGYDGTTNITITSDSNNAQMTAEVTYTSESDMCEKLLFIFNKMKDKLYHIIRSL